MSEKSDLIDVCGLWECISKSGLTYYSGRAGGMKFMLFPNRRKTDHEDDRQPSFHLKITEWVTREE
jgi:hypothetical protein